MKALLAVFAARVLYRLLPPLGRSFCDQGRILTKSIENVRQSNRQSPLPNLGVPEGLQVSIHRGAGAAARTVPHAVGEKIGLPVVQDRLREAGPWAGRPSLFENEGPAAWMRASSTIVFHCESL